MITMSSFIITLTGPSMCGKSYVMERIKEEKERLLMEGFFFDPVSVQKFTTRAYRLSELKNIQNGIFNDVESVEEIPSECEFVYKTYGQCYGVQKKHLSDLLEKNQSPVIVVNDVRVVEELKQSFPGRVLSLFLFRKVPKLEDFQKESASRGNTDAIETNRRYQKAISIYRTYIENMTLFDRVILNVRNFSGKENEIDYTKEQIHNVISGVLRGTINISASNKKGNKLFILSGSGASGKDEIITAVRKMGRMQAFILPKYTTRWQEKDDGEEMICQYIPREDLISKYLAEYNLEKEKLQNQFDQGPALFIHDQSFPCKEDVQSDEWLVQWEAFKMKKMRDIEQPMARFWHDKSAFETTQKRRGGALTAQSKQAVLDAFFERNPQYVDIDEIRLRHEKKISKVVKNQEEGVTGPSYYIEDGGVGYVIYENNKNSDNEFIKYAFILKDVLESSKSETLSSKIKKEKKHCIVAASLVDIFKYCKKAIGVKNVVTVFTYSQISSDEYQKKSSDSFTAEKSAASQKDIERYSKYIEFFDHVTIFAESTYGNVESGSEEELTDQIFRLFKAYKP